MRITFPHMGDSYIPVKVLLDCAGIEYIMPPVSGKGLLEQGVLHSPEFACLPFKTIMGDFLYGIEHGADCILFGGGCGQCRFGYFGKLQDEILKSIGYNVNFIYLDLSNISFKEVLEKIKPLTEGKSIFNLSKAILNALITVFKVDRINELCRFTRCREINKGQTNKIMYRFHNEVQIARGYKSINKIIRSTIKELKQVALDKKHKPLRVALVGEIYVAAHPQINFEIEKKLGNMGVEVHNTLGISYWIKEHFIKKLIPFKIKNKDHEAGKEFMKTDDIGGHGLSSIGASIRRAKKGFDGVVHIYPFTCMPEIIAQSTFSEVQQKYNIPIMTLIVDEMTGEAGYTTRLEAFIDMILMKKKASAVMKLSDNPCMPNNY
jgi:predicted nucleotide-binding protein (sugar kinase/HSP70/actin superfamily)